MRHAHWNDDNVTRPYFTTRVSCHCSAAGWAIQNCGDFVVWSRSCPIYDGPASDQHPFTRRDVVGLRRVVVKDTGRTFRTRLTPAARLRGAPRWRATGVCIATPHALICNGLTSRLRSMVDDGDAQLIAS